MKKISQIKQHKLKLAIDEPPIAMIPQTNVLRKDLNQKYFKNYSAIESEVSKIFANKLKELKAEEKFIETQDINLKNLKNEKNNELQNNNNLKNKILEAEKELEKTQNKYSRISKQKYENISLLSKKVNILNFDEKYINENLHKILSLISENSIEEKIYFWNSINSYKIEMIEFLIYLDKYFVSLEKQDNKKFNYIKNLIDEAIANDDMAYPYDKFLCYLYNIVQCILLNIKINEIKTKIKHIDSEKSISFIKLRNIESSIKETEKVLKEKKNYMGILLEVINNYISIKKNHEQNLINNDMYFNYLLNIKDADLSERKPDANKNNNININNVSNNKTSINSSNKENCINTNEFLLSAIPYFKKSKIVLYKNDRKNFKCKESRNTTNKKIPRRKIKSNITSNNNSINSIDLIKEHRSYNSTTNCRKFSNDYLFILEGPVDKKVDNDNINININKEIENNKKNENKKRYEKRKNDNRKRKILESAESNQNLENSMSSYNINDSSQNSIVCEVLNKKKKKIGVAPLPFPHKSNNNTSFFNSNSYNKNNKLSNENEIQLFNKKTLNINSLKKQKIKEIFNHSMIPKPSKKRYNNGNIINFLKSMSEKNTEGKNNSCCIKIKYSIGKKLNQNTETKIKNIGNSYDNKRNLYSEKTVKKQNMKNIRNLINIYSSENIFKNRNVISRNCSPKTINKVNDTIKKLNENKNSFSTNKNTSISHYNSSYVYDDTISSKKMGGESFSVGKKDFIRRNFHADANKNFRNSGCFNSCT